MSTKKEYAKVTMELFVYRSDNILCTSGDLFTIDIYDDEWSDADVE